MKTSCKQNSTGIFEGTNPIAGHIDMAMNEAEGKRIVTDCIISFLPSFRLNKQRPDREKAGGIQMDGRAHLASDY
jgi:hypothetical protein